MHTLSGSAPALAAYCAHTRQCLAQSLARQEQRCRGGKGFGKTADRQRNGRHKRLERGHAEGGLPPNELLKKFHTSADKVEVAEANAASLTEKFFVVADAMLKMAEKEGNQMMKSEYIAIIQAAMQVRQKTLRPEIRLLNELMMASTGPQQRQEIIRSREGAETLIMNDRYFFSLLEGMMKDLAQREEGEDKKAIMQHLKDLEQQCRLRAQQYDQTGG